MIPTYGHTPIPLTVLKLIEILSKSVYYLNYFRLYMFKVIGIVITYLLTSSNNFVVLSFLLVISNVYDFYLRINFITLGSKIISTRYFFQ